MTQPPHATGAHLTGSCALCHRDPPLCAFLSSSALCGKRAWHHLDITGSNGQQLGRVRVGFRVGKPIDKLLLLQHQQTQEQQQREEEGEEKQAMQEEGQRQVVAAGGVDEDAAAALALQQAAEQVRHLGA